MFSKPPLDGPDSVLAYLARYTHRVAISNHRLVELDEDHVLFRYKDYRSRRTRHLELGLHEFARRFLLHLLPPAVRSHPLLRVPRQRLPEAQDPPVPRGPRGTRLGPRN